MYKTPLVSYDEFTVILRDARHMDLSSEGNGDPRKFFFPFSSVRRPWESQAGNYCYPGH